MGKPTLSIIMIVFNAERFISEAINSVLEQTFDDFELIIIDDGSGYVRLNKIKSFVLLCKSHNEIASYFYGPHHNYDCYSKIVAGISRSEARDKIHLSGTLDNMPGFYSAIDCFVLSGRAETLRLVYIEAMSCKGPVIVCRAGGQLDMIVENKNGCLTEPGSPYDLADKMERYLEKKELVEEHGKYSGKIVENKFSTDIMVKNHQELYPELLK